MMPDSQNLSIEVYAVAGTVPFTEWLDGLPDLQARARIRARIDRLESGNPGRYEDLRGGLRELKIDWGPGYRVYWAQTGRTIVLLLCGGDKRNQTKDIETARRYLADYMRRNDETKIKRQTSPGPSRQTARAHRRR